MKNLRSAVLWKVNMSLGKTDVSEMIEATCSTELSFLSRATWRYIPEDGILVIAVNECDGGGGADVCNPK
jgi:hypothetical protein